MEIDNKKLWLTVADTPDYAKRPIEGGRLNGMTDINPMWRFERLTEIFGPCGIGWKYIIKDQRVIPGAESEQMAFLDIDLYYRLADGGWSEPVPGIGGSMLIEKERNGYHSNDEAFKMALSDAIGTACKALGFSADIYFSGKGRTGSKYQKAQEQEIKLETKEDAANLVITFGKHSGKTLRQIFAEDKEYIRWLADKAQDDVVRKAVGMILDAVKNG